MVGAGGALAGVAWKCGQSCAVSRLYSWLVAHPTREGEGDVFGGSGGKVGGGGVMYTNMSISSYVRTPSIPVLFTRNG